MPVVSTFFGIIIRMYYNDHNPPHIHVEYQDSKAVVDFKGNILKGDLASRTALKLVREWVDLHPEELVDDWNAAREGRKIKRIDPLD
ncbi:DUF4160 domain-containing protein [Pontiellaceae bacterium B12227]|nr:DUF4160 domain-containing protein [Pontiellaceae bacterium B12227]